MWTLEKIWNWYQKQPWIVSFNYLPSNAVNSESEQDLLKEYATDFMTRYGNDDRILLWDLSKNPLEGMPQIWQHDIFHGDLTPYCQEEIDLIRQLTR